MEEQKVIQDIEDLLELNFCERIVKRIKNRNIEKKYSSLVWGTWGTWGTILKSPVEKIFFSNKFKIWCPKRPTCPTIFIAGLYPFVIKYKNL